MEINEDDFDSHFYDNPILSVKKRQEKRKKLDQNKLKNDINDDEDLYYETKSRKFYVKDLEKVEREQKRAEKRKREDRDEFLEKMIPNEMKHLISIEDQVRTGVKRKKIAEDDEVEMDTDEKIGTLGSNSIKLCTGIQLPGRTNKRGKSKITGKKIDK